jgi:hypothetical protein
MEFSSQAARRAALGFHDFDDFAAFVFAAVRAGTVRTDLFVAIGALGELRDREVVMGAASGGAALRMASFGIRHSISLLQILLHV